MHTLVLDELYLHLQYCEEHCENHWLDYKTGQCWGDDHQQPVKAGLYYYAGHHGGMYHFCLRYNPTTAPEPELPDLCNPLDYVICDF